jgi:hypothetical protein
MFLRDKSDKSDLQPSTESRPGIINPRPADVFCAARVYLLILYHSVQWFIVQNDAIVSSYDTIVSS